MTCRTHKCIAPVHIFKTLDRSPHQAARIPSQRHCKLLPLMHRAKSVTKVEANQRCSYFRLRKEESFKQPQKKHANSPKEYLKLRSEAGNFLLWGDSTNHRTTPQVGYVFPPKPLFSPSSFGQRRLCVPALITPDSKLSLWRCCRHSFDVCGVHLQPGNLCYPSSCELAQRSSRIYCKEAKTGRCGNCSLRRLFFIRCCRISVW